ncbi:MAG: DUF427 domain-containing protein [Rhodobacteraceae bacterium]|nr:DUF427 domain-containing protein [Paracoccaceae bacterium]
MRAKIDQLKKDGYRIDTSIQPGRAVATWHGKVIAESTRAVVLNETRHAPVIYFPRSDARMEMLLRTAHTTHCPFKGDASYFAIVDGADRAENAVWSYESPIPECAAIREYLAFYTSEMGAKFGIDVKVL